MAQTAFQKRYSNYAWYVKQGKADTNSGRIGLQNYREFLASPYWKEIKSRFYKDKRKRCCFLCNAKKKLNIHHISYRNMFKGDMSQLITLCQPCHYRVHTLPFGQRSRLRDFQRLQRTWRPFRSG